MKNSIVCADDFGLTKSVNKAIIDIYKIGNLNLTSLMTNMPGTEDALKLANKHKNLNVGLHFNITEGPSIVGKSTLTDNNGIFLSRNKLIKKIYFGKVLKNDVLKEFIEQLRICENNNLNIKTVDSHQHIHSINFIFKSILPEIIKRNLSMRSCYANIKFSIKRCNHLLSNLYLYKNRKNKVFRNSVLTSIYHQGKIFNDIDYRDCLNKINLIYEKAELMIHPYKKDNDLKSLYKNNYQVKKKFLSNCFQEYKILSKKRIFYLN